MREIYGGEYPSDIHIYRTKKNNKKRKKKNGINDDDEHWFPLCSISISRIPPIPHPLSHDQNESGKGCIRSFLFSSLHRSSYL